MRKRPEPYILHLTLLHILHFPSFRFYFKSDCVTFSWYLVFFKSEKTNGRFLCYLEKDLQRDGMTIKGATLDLFR